MTANDIHLLTGAYVLDSLDDAERDVFTRHLDECEGCAGEVAELRETVVRLADDSWAVPPPRLRQNVMDQIRATRQLPPVQEAPARLAPQRQAPDRQAPDRQTPAPQQARPNRTWARRAAYGLAAAFLAVVAGGGTYLVQEQRVRDAQADYQAALAQEQKMEAVMSAPDAKFKVGPVMGGGQVTVISSASRDAAVVLLARAAAPGPEQAYEFWMIENGSARPATILAAGEPAGRTYIEGLGRTDTIGMTKEKAAGASTPTEPILAAIPVT
jgi:hypothetical protein